MPRPLNDTPYLYGLHDDGGEHHMVQGHAPGWVLLTVAIGHNASDQGPGDDGRFRGDYRRLTNQGLGVMVRLNNGYGPNGTLPYERYYDDFARRCANFVRLSQGCSIWIVGNEPNHPVEWPGAEWNWDISPPRPWTPQSEGEKITPARYAACYLKVRGKIHALSGHENDLVLVGAPAPWNNLTAYDGNPNGDWVRYFTDVLNHIGPGQCDGITLHAYTHGTDANLVFSDAKVGDARFKRYRWHFRTYRDFMEAIPQTMRHLPVFLTETDQGDVAWEDRNSGWVRNAYKEIDDWNQQGNQRIRSVILYRWPRVGNDRWWIVGKSGVIEDFRQSLSRQYAWDALQTGAGDLIELARRVEALESQAGQLDPAVAQIETLSPQAGQLQQVVTGLVAKGQQATDLRRQLSDLAAELSRLQTAVAVLAGAAVPRPDMQDVRDTLPKHASKTWPVRPLTDATRLIIHHTATRSDISAERIAQYHVGQGLPGIKYHFMIGGDGTIFWTQPSEAVVSQTAVQEANLTGVAVTLAGTYNTRPPGEDQLDATARLLAWLASLLQLDVAAIVGRSELDSSDPSNSPGKQWQEGAVYKNDLVARTQAILAQYGHDDELALLRRRVGELEARVADLEGQAAQVPQLQARVQQLQTAVAEKDDQLTHLAAENSHLLAENARLLRVIQSLQGTAVQKPAVVDVVDTLPKHQTLTYGRRTSAITGVVVHHTDTPRNFTVEQVAHYHVHGVRRNNQGQIVKAQWPGIGYHYVVMPDGTIYQGNRHETRSYHAGDVNDHTLGVSLIGRFMRRNHDGTAVPEDDRLPTEAQMRSTSHLIAWLMQEMNISSVSHVVGHKEVSDTTCPGDQWMQGATWKETLHGRIETARNGVAKSIPYMLLFWDHGDNWARSDWQSAQNYVAHFRPAVGFSTQDAMAARVVVIVGGDAGVSGHDEAALRASGAEVYRLAGANEAETRALLDALVANNTPWPGATPQQPPRFEAGEGASDGFGEAIVPKADEWTVPDDYQVPPQGQILAQQAAPWHRVKVEGFAPSQPEFAP